LACRMIEKALQWDLEQFDFDRIVQYARNDFLLGGAGILIERYKPVFGVVEDDAGEKFEVKLDEKVVTEYVDPVNFVADCEKVGIWEDCTWFGIRHYMSMDEAVQSFGNDLLNEAIDNSMQEIKLFEVYEIWDKISSKVYYVSKVCPLRFLKVVDKADDGISGFFPMPKPLLATCTNDSIIPVPDYVQIKPLLDELDGVMQRMQKTMKALKVSGCYDNAFPELSNILNKDVALVSISDFERLKSAGGIRNIVDFMPIEQYVTALTALAVRRQDIIDAIYEVTGVSDIMRGSSNVGDTATAVTQKTSFGTLRNQDRQNDMQRFIAELFKIKVEMICQNFDEEKLLSFLPMAERDSVEAAAAAKLLKRDKLRSMVLSIESEATFNERDVFKKNMEVVASIHSMVGQAFDVVSKQPALLGLYRQMISSIVAGMSNARQFENAMTKAFDIIEAELGQPNVETEPDARVLMLELQRERNAQDFAIKKEQNDLKRAEILLKQQQEHAKNILTAQEMQLQVELKKSGVKDANITTGFVKAL